MSRKKLALELLQVSLETEYSWPQPHHEVRPDQDPYTYSSGYQKGVLKAMSLLKQYIDVLEEPEKKEVE